MIICFDWDKTLVKECISDYCFKKRKEILNLDSENYTEQINELMGKLNCSESFVRKLFSNIFSYLYIMNFNETHFIPSIGELQDLAKTHTLILATGNHEEVLKILVKKYDLPFDKIYTTDNLAKSKKVDFHIPKIDIVIGDGIEDEQLAKKHNAKYIFFDETRDLKKVIFY